MIALSLFAFLAACDIGRHRIDIESRDLPSALLEFAHDERLELFQPEAPLRGLQAGSVHGEYTAAEALTLILAPTRFCGSIVDGDISLRPRQRYENVCPAPRCENEPAVA